MSIDADKINFSYKNKKVLQDFSISLNRGDFTMLLGANGSGKSTVIRLLGGFLTPQSGSVVADNVPIAEMKNFERSRKIAVVTQTMPPILDFTVSEMVMMGRLGNLPRLAPPAANDWQIVADIMKKMEVDSFADRPINQLSGGERQRVMLAQAIARQSDYLLLDEPTSALDPEHCFMLMRELKKINQNTGILMVCHDLNLAWNYAQKVIILKDSKIFLAGPTREILTPANIRNAFNCDAEICGTNGILLKNISTIIQQ